MFFWFQFIIAAFVAVSYAARLEHLERSYLPPGNNRGPNSFGSNAFGSPGSTSSGFQGSNGFNSFGSGSQGASRFGSQGSNGFGSQGTFGAGNGASAFHSGSNLNAATSNQYLPPNQGSGSNGGL